MKRPSGAWRWTWDDTHSCLGCLIMLVLLVTACRLAWKVLIWAWS